MDEAPGCLACDPAPPGDDDLPVEARRHLVGDKRAPFGNPDPPGLVLDVGLPLVQQLDLDSRRSQRLDPSGRLGVGIAGTDDDTCDAFGDHPVDAGRRRCRGARTAPASRTSSSRLRALAGGLECDHLGVAATGLGDALAENGAVGGDDRTDGRFRVGPSGGLGGDAQSTCKRHRSACIRRR